MRDNDEQGSDTLNPLLANVFLTITFKNHTFTKIKIQNTIYM